jgi:heme oxygenase
LNITADSIRPSGTGPSLVVARLRAATGEAHKRLEDRLDAVNRLADPAQRAGLLARYAAFHGPTEAALAPWLAQTPGLYFASRCRAPLLPDFTGAPEFPAPQSTGEALGVLYVLEGSTLGGRMIMRALADRGVDDLALTFLDPYGTDTGARWRSFLDVLIRYSGEDEGLIAEVCRGGVAGFRYAERVLCEDQS